MAKAKREFNYTFHLTQEDLEEIEILCPLVLNKKHTSMITCMTL